MSLSRPIKYKELFKLSYESEISVNGVEGNYVGMNIGGWALWYSLDDLRVRRIPKRARIISYQYLTEVERFTRLLEASKR
jgi:hypothetical protein